MNNFLQALSNQAISAITLLVAIIGGGTLVVYRLDALETFDQSQIERIDTLVEEVTNMRITMAGFEEQVGYLRTLQERDGQRVLVIDVDDDDDDLYLPDGTKIIRSRD